MLATPWFPYSILNGLVNTMKSFQAEENDTLETKLCFTNYLITYYNGFKSCLMNKKGEWYPYGPFSGVLKDSRCWTLKNRVKWDFNGLPL